MMNGEHGFPPRIFQGHWRIRAALGASRSLESRGTAARYITRVLLTNYIYPDNISSLRLEGHLVSPVSDGFYIAFAGDRRIASGDLRKVARAAKQAVDRRDDEPVLVFDDASSGPIEIDFRGTVGDVLARLPRVTGAPAALDEAAQPAARGPGRPKLGVVAREITLLPRHWDWLAQQAGGASVAIRKLVEEARRTGEHKDRLRQAQEAAYRFMSVMVGNKPHYEDAIRALFAGNPARFEELIAGWPADVRDHASRLAERAFHREAPVDPANASR
jgi:uncharacterized protein